jgi:YVTN family beta-propeller protein
LRTFLLLVVALAVVGGLGWWYFRESQLPDYGPAYREYAYVTNGKSNTVSVIDLRTFQPARTIPVGNEPTGIAANGKKNEVYVVNTQSNSVSVIDAERNEVVATIGVHAAPYLIDVSTDGKRAYVANSKSANVWSWAISGWAPRPGWHRSRRMVPPSWSATGATTRSH